MLKYYIITPDYDPHSGGSLALHLLGHELTKLGEDVTLCCNFKNPLYEGKILSGDIDYRNAVGIYPEIIVGNPYKFKNVVRWLLNTPGVCGGNGIYEYNDIIYKYSNFFKYAHESEVKGLLSPIYIDTEVFKNHGKHTKGKMCHIIRKGHYKKQINHLSDSICIDGYEQRGGNKYLSKIFNECEYCVSYDHSTMLYLQAALCGCKVIVIPDENVSIEEWKKSAPYNFYGVAYGFEDLNWIEESLPYLKEHVEIMHKKSINSIINFNNQIKTLTNGVH